MLHLIQIPIVHRCPMTNKAIFIMTSSNGNIFRVTGPLWGESTGHRWFPSHTPVTRRFDVSFDARLSKGSISRWFEMPWLSLWRHSVWWVQVMVRCASKSLQWRHNEHNGVSNHQRHDCLLDRFSGAGQRKQQSSASLAPRHWPLSPTKGQWRGKCFHLMTSSWWIIGTRTNEQIISDV